MGMPMPMPGRGVPMGGPPLPPGMMQRGMPATMHAGMVPPGRSFKRSMNFAFVPSPMLQCSVFLFRRVLSRFAVATQMSAGDF